MKLACIYNVWDGVELLQGSMECIKNDVDLFIIVYQDVSNFGEKYDPLPEITEAMKSFPEKEFHLHKYTPDCIAGAFNERKKRNIGLEITKQHECTHFLHMDTDEYYWNFGLAKKQYVESGKNGSVCKLFTYFKKPVYRFDVPDGYFVPFIHKLKPDSEAGVKKYPFYVDPTRRINEADVIELPVFMHHFSYIRNDIERKVRNSSAKINIERSNLLKDYYSEELGRNPEGFYVKDFSMKLTVVEDIFKIGDKTNSQSLT